MFNDGLREPTYFEKAIYGMLLKMFPQYVDKFNIVTMKRSIHKDSKEVWAMNTGKIPEIVDIYFNGDWLCEVFENMMPQQVEAKIIYCLNRIKKGLEEQQKRGL